MKDRTHLYADGKYTITLKHKVVRKYNYVEDLYAMKAAALALKAGAERDIVYYQRAAQAAQLEGDEDKYAGKINLCRMIIIDCIKEIATIKEELVKWKGEEPMKRSTQKAYIAYTQYYDEDRNEKGILEVEKGGDWSTILSGKIFESLHVYDTRAEAEEALRKEGH